MEAVHRMKTVEIHRSMQTNDTHYYIYFEGIGFSIGSIIVHDSKQEEDEVIPIFRLDVSSTLCNIGNYYFFIN